MKMSKKKVDNIIVEYNEKQNLKELFSFVDSRRECIYKLMFTQQKPLQIVSLVLKYLLKVKEVKPLKTEKIIRKWCVLICYYYITIKYEYPNKTKELDELLENDLTIEALDKCVITTNELIANIFNDNEEVNKNYNKNINLFINSLKGIVKEEDRSNICILKINNILKTDNYFFTNHNNQPYSFDGSFNQFANNKSFDRLIPEVLNSASVINFKIEFTNNEFINCVQNYVDNDPSSSKVKKNIPLIFGYMVSQIIKDDNFKLDKKIKYLTTELLLLQKNQQKCDIIIDGFKPKTKDKLLKDEIVSCKFKLDDEEYLFSSNGLERL